MAGTNRPFAAPLALALAMLGRGSGGGPLLRRCPAELLAMCFMYIAHVYHVCISRLAAARRSFRMKPCVCTCCNM